MLDATFETIARDSEIGGGILAAALAYRIFFFLLPLGFFLVSGLGFLARALDTSVQAIVSDLGLSGIITEQVANTADDSSIWVLLGSLVLLAYVTRSLSRAVTVVHALAWERSAASALVTGRLVAVFAAVVAGQLAAVVGVSAARAHTEVGAVVALLFFVAVVGGLWLWFSLEAPHSTARWTGLVPGALLYGIGILCVQVFNAYILGRLVESKSSTYGVLGVAAAILLSLFFSGRVIVGAAALNATLFERSRRSGHS